MADIDANTVSSTIGEYFGIWGGIRVGEIITQKSANFSTVYPKIVGFFPDKL